MHPNEDLLRREYDAFAREDLTSLDEIFADDIVYHVPGHNPFSGDARGRRRSRSCSDKTGAPRSGRRSTTSSRMIGMP
jgi:ketosteroid isomerase-like protein